MIRIRNRDEISDVIAHVVVNCAALSSDKIARLVGIGIAEAGYKLH